MNGYVIFMLGLALMGAVIFARLGMLRDYLLALVIFTVLLTLLLCIETYVRSLIL